MRARSLLVCVLLLVMGRPAWAADPALPTSFVSTDTIATVDGNTYCVNPTGGGFAGCTGTNLSSIQTAINTAAAADGSLTHDVVIQAGTSFTQNLTLPAKSGTNPTGTGWILVRTSNLVGIASQGQRIVPATHAAEMPKINLGGAVHNVETAAGAHHYRFIGIEFIKASGLSNQRAITLWNGGSTTVANLPSFIIIDRCIIRTTSAGLLLGMHGPNIALIDSFLQNTTAPGFGDSANLHLFSGPGPVKVVNNWIEAVSNINVFFGATDYIIGGGYAPQDIEFRRNYVSNPAGTSATNGKNLIEWKQGLRVWVAGNIFSDGQFTGQQNKIQLSPRIEGANDGDGFVNDLTIEYNLFRRLAQAAMGLSGGEALQTAQSHSVRVAVRHNFFDDIGVTYTGGSGGDGDQFWIGQEQGRVTDQHTIEHNTVRNAPGVAIHFVTGGTPTSHTQWILRNNLLRGTVNAINGGTSTGTAALNQQATTRVFTNNVFVGASSGNFTGTDLSNNFFPASASLNADGSLAAGSPYLNAATDGTDIGANFTTLYGTASGIGQFGTGANDYYAFTGQWPPGTPDTTPPSDPTNLVVTTVSSSQLNLSWTASTDNVNVTGYRIERCLASSCTFAQVATSPGVTYNDLNLTASTIYRYQVRAEDAAGNLSGYSNIATGTTAAPDTTAPTAPTNLQATAASSTQINLSWTASTDAVGVTNYRIERCSGSGCSGFAEIATNVGTVYNDTGLTASTLYRYQVRAEDAAGNLSGYSSIAEATTSAAPATLTVEATSSAISTSGSATLSWTHPGITPNLVIVGVTVDQSANIVSGITYGGQALTLLRAQGSVGCCGRTELWYRVSPLSGSQSVNVTLTGATMKVGGAITLTGVDTTSPLGTPLSSSGTSTTASTSVSSVTNALVVAVLGVSLNGSETATIGANQTARWNLFSDGFIRGVGSTIAGAATVTPTWTLSSSLDWTVTAVSVNPAAGTPTSSSESPTDTVTLTESLAHNDVLDQFTLDVPSLSESVTLNTTMIPGEDAVTLSESLVSVLGVTLPRPPVSDRPSVGNRPAVPSRPAVTDRPPV